MAQNPFQPPVNDGPAAPKPRKTIDAALAKSIGERIKRLNRKSLSFGALGLVAQFAVQFTEGPPIRPLLLLGGTGLFIYGLALYAQMRNRSGWWGALGMLSCLGLVILLFLPKRCHNCGATTKGKTCEECGAPAPM